VKIPENLVAYLVALSRVLSAWTVIALALTGFGLLIQRAAGRVRIDGRSLLAAFWFGVAGTVGLLQVWHFLVPIDTGSALLVSALGGAGFVVAAAALRTWLATRSTRNLVFGGFALLAIGAFSASQMLGPMQYYDTAMYHIPAVEWYKAYAVVPGLANLHGRLGFNSSFHLFAALLDRGPLAERSSFIALGLLVSAVVVQACYGALRLIGRRSDDPADFFDLVLLAPCLGVLLSPDVRSLSTDIAAAAVLFAASSQLFRILWSRDMGTRETATQVLLAGALLSLAPTFKPTAALFSAGAWMILLMVSFRAGRAGALPLRRTLLSVIVVSAALLLPWLVHGIVLSGYPIYPTRLGAWPADWRVPAEQAAAQFAFTRWTGLDEWMKQFPFLELLDRKQASDRLRILVPTAASLCTLFALSLRRLRGISRVDDRNPSVALVALVIVVSVAAWYVVAPWPRYVFALLWILAALASAELFADLTRDAKSARWPGAVATILAVVLAAYPMVDRPGVWRRVSRGRNVVRVIVRQLLPATPPSTWLSIDPNVDLRTYTTRSGLRLWEPQGDLRCWYAALPCTPHPAPGLELRRVGSLGGGFRIAGPWQPDQWPFPGSDFLARWRSKSLHRPDR
jgi:hypothetical protein